MRTCRPIYIYHIGLAFFLLTRDVDSERLTPMCTFVIDVCGPFARASVYGPHVPPMVPTVQGDVRQYSSDPPTPMAGVWGQHMGPAWVVSRI